MRYHWSQQNSDSDRFVNCVHSEIVASFEKKIDSCRDGKIDYSPDSKLRQAAG